MSVKDMLYAAVNYASQVDKARRSYRSKGDEGEIIIHDDAPTIKLAQAEFLSGFRKDDRLIPVVTAVMYFGSEEWDGPLSIHDMLKTTDERILRVIPDYRINLISSTAIPDEEFDTKFSAGLGLALHAIKYSKTKAVEILMATNHKMIDRESGVLIREALNIDLEFSEPKEKGVVDVCKAVSDYTLKEKVLTAIDILKDEGHSDEDIIRKMIKKYNVTKICARADCSGSVKQNQCGPPCNYSTNILPVSGIVAGWASFQSSTKRVAFQFISSVSSSRLLFCPTALSKSVYLNTYDLPSRITTPPGAIHVSALFSLTTHEL